MTKVNPKIVPTQAAHDAAAEIAANGGNLTAEEWQRVQDWTSSGWAPTRTAALRMAAPDGAIFGGPGGWKDCRPSSAPSGERAQG